MRETLVHAETDSDEVLAGSLACWAQRQQAVPVLFFQGDDDLLMVSRQRELLAENVRFVIADSELIEDLVDKVRFAGRAQASNLPVPATAVVSRGRAPEVLSAWDAFPAVLKPANRHGWFGSPLQRHLQGSHKAIALRDARDVAELLPLLCGHTTDFVLQKAVAGPEANIVSYHVYVRDDGTIAAEFTGKKLRTFPITYGLSTCVAITDDAEVRALGRKVTEKLGLTGVAKLDFKRDADDGKLYLLEINPRFTLWNHLGARAGVDIPKLVYDDLTGEMRRHVGPARPGAIWMSSRADFKAVLAEKASVLGWLREFAMAEVRSDLSFADPLPDWLNIAAALGRFVGNLRQGAGA